MRKALSLLISLLLVAATVMADNTIYVPFEGTPDGTQYVPDQFVVKFKSTSSSRIPIAAKGNIVTGLPDIDVLNQRFGVVAIEEEFPGAQAEAGAPDLSGYRIVTYNGSRPLEEVISAYAACPQVESVEPIGIHPFYDAVPNDYYFSGQAYPWYQWGYADNTDNDIDGPCAWGINPGNPNVTVAVLDGGVRYYHKDLGGAAWPTTSGNIWINPGEIKGNGIDDDGNGFIDDWMGWDWVTGVKGCKKGEDCSTPDNDPADFGGHGSHCAGIVAAMTNNNRGVAGTAGGWGDGTINAVGNGAKVMCLRIGWLSSGGTGYVRMDFAAQAFYYAANMGANIASCSWGSSNTSGMGAAIDYAISKGVLVVHAAGNSNNETADYLGTRTDVVNVAATDSSDLKASFSSYGTWVDVSAPGVDIASTYHNYSDPTNDYYAVMSGTSMATPMVAGVAALIKSQFPSYSWLDIHNRLESTADNIDVLNPTYAGKLGTGRVNACRAIGGTPAPKEMSLHSIPMEFALYQNYPNPFNPGTSISFYLPEHSKINLTVYNILGEKVKTLADGEFEAGSHAVTWDGTNQAGAGVASGIYFYKMTAGDKSVTKKMSLLK
ncbi:Peptidase S8 and S53 subtilisin kexin sedolisin (fragment) [Candidatus Zixiibacteriota bacterium]